MSAADVWQRSTPPYLQAEVVELAAIMLRKRS